MWYAGDIYVIVCAVSSVVLTGVAFLLDGVLILVIRQMVVDL